MNKLGNKIVHGKELRYGFTTGTCATAAAKAALSALISKKIITEIDVETNSGKKLSLPIEKMEFKEDSVKCGIQKDSGDDPDITNGMFVFVEVRFAKEGIIFKAGEGVGTVTERGLAIPPGEPAINPGPREMITNELNKILPKGKGVEITVSIPGGEEIARRTFNPKLGIKGGLSILGTTGILEPMSVDAIRETKRLELNQVVLRGGKNIILTPGNYGENFVENILELKNAPIIKTSNYIGDVLLHAENKSLEGLLIVGHIGKIIKLAGGIFNTHSKIADGRMEIFAALAASEGLSVERVNRVLETNTTDSAIEIIEEEFDDQKRKKLYLKIAERVTKKVSCYIHESMKIGTVIFSLQKGELAVCNSGMEILKELRDE